jgi:chromosomal replication initiator protein
MEFTLPTIQSATWSSVLDDIRASIGEQRHSLWFSNVHPIDFTDNTVTLGVPNLFVRDWVSSRFSKAIRDAFANHLSSPVKITYTIDPTLFRKHREEQLDVEAEIVEAAARPAPPRRRAIKSDDQIRADFTLDRYIVGGCNKLAHACATEIIDGDCQHLHPLFIHSHSGSGKTHLLQAMWHEIRRMDDGRNVAYLSAESFTNQFVYAMRNHRLDSFRHKYRSADILMIDDVHFVNNKRGFQEELLHTFDAIASHGCILVCASDVHPKMLTEVREGLTNRFASGMVVKMKAPSLATRTSIIRAKARELGQNMPETAVRHIAESHDGSIRDLIGALTMVVAYASLTNEPLTLALAKHALAGSKTSRAGKTGLKAIEKTVGEHFNMDPTDWRGSSLTRAVRFPRQVCMYVARECSEFSCREIAKHFNAANHSSVIFATKRVRERMHESQAVADQVEAIIQTMRLS